MTTAIILANVDAAGSVAKYDERGRVRARGFFRANDYFDSENRGSRKSLLSITFRINRIILLLRGTLCGVSARSFDIYISIVFLFILHNTEL